jgi:hypothetical protein
MGDHAYHESLFGIGHQRVKVRLDLRWAVALLETIDDFRVCDSNASPIASL